MCLHYRIEKLNLILAFALPFNIKMTRTSTAKQKCIMKHIEKRNTQHRFQNGVSKMAFHLHRSWSIWICSQFSPSFSAHLCFALALFFYIVKINFMFPFKVYACTFFRSEKMQAFNTKNITFAVFHSFSQSFFSFFLSFFIRAGTSTRSFFLVLLLGDRRENM